MNLPQLLRRVILLLAIIAPAAQAQILFKSGDKVAFLGDSITAQGWTYPHGYVRLVVTALDVNAVKIVPLPAGVGGNRSNDMLARLKRDVLDKKPDWVTISCGMNDVIHGAKGIPLDQYKLNMTSIVTQCQAAGIKVIILTTTTAGAWNSDQSKQLSQYSAFLRDLAKEKNCPLADLNAAFVSAMKAGLPHQGWPGWGLTGDGVHMTEEGNQLFAATLLATLGFTQDQLARSRQAWLDLPDAGTVRARANVDLKKSWYFDASLPLTLRQREKVKDAAARANRPLMHWLNELLLAEMKTLIKPAGPYESLPAIFESHQEKEAHHLLEEHFRQKIRAIVEPPPSSD